MPNYVRRSCHRKLTVVVSLALPTLALVPAPTLLPPARRHFPGTITRYHFGPTTPPNWHRQADRKRQGLKS